jgi:hypothetical protein
MSIPTGDLKVVWQYREVQPPDGPSPLREGWEYVETEEWTVSGFGHHDGFLVVVESSEGDVDAVDPLITRCFFDSAIYGDLIPELLRRRRDWLVGRDFQATIEGVTPELFIAETAGML